MNPIDEIKPVALDSYGWFPFWLAVTSAAGAAFMKYGPMAVDLWLKVSADRREHKKLDAQRQTASPALPDAEAPPTQREPAPLPPHVVGHRASAQPSIPDVPSRAEVDARIADLRAEMLREVGEAKAEAKDARRFAERAQRGLERLKGIVDRGLREIVERLATLEGWIRGTIEGGPGSRRRGG